jgi:hypothetical protein
VDRRGVNLEIGVQHGPRCASYIPLSLHSFQTQSRGHGSAPKRVNRARRFTARPWDAKYHEPEDSFFLWGPQPPADFTINREA